MTVAFLGGAFGSIELKNDRVSPQQMCCQTLVGRTNVGWLHTAFSKIRAANNRAATNRCVGALVERDLAGGFVPTEPTPPTFSLTVSLEIRGQTPRRAQIPCQDGKRYE
jgi:hypothetical protein